MLHFSPYSESEIKRLRIMARNGCSMCVIAVAMNRAKEDIHQQMRFLEIRVHRPKFGAPASLDGEISIVQIAEKILYQRIAWKLGQRLLDGIPCDLDRLMKSANIHLAYRGEKQLGRNPKWMA